MAKRAATGLDESGLASEPKDDGNVIRHET